MFSKNEPIDIYWQEVYDWSRETVDKIFIEGDTLIDSYNIPNSEVEQYVKDREALAIEINNFYSSLGLKVKRCFAGSEDGEAIIGLNKQGEIEKFIYLDPETVEGWKNTADVTTFLASFS